MTRAGTLGRALRPTCWMLPRLTSLTFARAALACASLLLASAASAAQAGFIEGLSPDERAASGLARLAPAQAARLDALVGRDVSLAHEGGVTGFASSFTARRTPQERAEAGIDPLSAGERSMLDVLAARAIAYGPPAQASFSYAASAAPPETLVSAPPKAQVHGDLSLTVGGGSHGSSFYGTSADLFVTDPSGRFTVGVSVSTFRSKGFVGPYGPGCLAPPDDTLFPFGLPLGPISRE